MASADIDYARNIKKYEKLVARNKWQVSQLPSWAPGVKNKPIIISEGDSWFDYPVKSLTDVLGVLLRYTTGLQNFGMDSKTNVIDFVSRDDDLDGIFLRIERSGDHAQELASKTPDKCDGVWEDKFPSQTLYTALQNKTVSKHLDCIMLSAGGNDMVNAVRHGGIQTYASSWDKSYDFDVIRAAAVEIVQFYLQAILYRDQFSPKANILCHSYAYATQVYRGTTTQFDMKDVGWLIEKLLGVSKLPWIEKGLSVVGVDIKDVGSYTMQSDSNLHKTLDDFGWPANPINDEKVGVHPERAEFIKLMLDSLYDEVQRIPELYKAETGKDIIGFYHLDIRNEVQDPKYWADFIHLNSLGYQKVSDKFVKKLQSILSSKN